MGVLATYNLLHGRCLVRGGAVDLGAVTEAIAALGADVVAVQEVDRGLDRSGGIDQVAELAEALGWDGAFAPALLGDPDRAWEALDGDDPGDPAFGVGLLSAHPIVAAQRLRLPGGGDGSRQRPASPQRPGWDREPRVALRARVALPQTTLTVTTTHLSYLPWRALAQLRAAARFARDDATVLLGDLNLPPGAVRRALPGWRHAGGAPTYPSWNPRVQVDHALADGVGLGAARVAEGSTSDHLPLLVDLRM